jgi:hypothetical protein
LLNCFAVGSIVFVIVWSDKIRYSSQCHSAAISIP